MVGSRQFKSMSFTPCLSVVKKMFSETVRRSLATLPGHHHCCYFGVRAETKQCSTLVRLMSVGTVLCGAAEVGQAQPRAGSEGAELHSR